MSTIKLLLEKQAEAVKTNSQKIKQAEDLEKQAAKLRSEANKPVFIGMKAIRQAKDERIDRFSKAMADGKKKEIDQLLTNDGWSRSFRNDKEAKYVKKATPGYSIIVKGNKFSAYYYEQVKADSLDTFSLPDFLKTLKNG